MSNCESFNNSEKKAMPHSFEGASYYAMQLSLTEIGLGSFLHAFRIPFSGFLLSLNQCFILMAIDEFVKQLGRGYSQANFDGNNSCTKLAKFIPDS